MLQQLLDASILEREFPFAESARSTKKTPYRIQDPTLRFWFRVFSPHRTRWHRYEAAEKARLFHEHAATVFEDFCRRRHPQAARYWEGSLEFDFVRQEKPGRLVVTEVKWRRLSATEKAHVEDRLKENWQKSVLSRKYPTAEFEVLDATLLATDRPQTA